MFRYPYIPDDIRSATPQLAPKPSSDDITELVIEDLKVRRSYGVSKYGRTLRAFNGRDSLLDAYQEALDLVQYLRQVIEERAADGQGGGRAWGKQR